MKLEFEKGIIHETVFSELGLQDYLSQFEADIPLLPHKVFRPLEEQEARASFDRLIALATQADRHHIDLGTILSASAKLPSLEALLPFFRDGELEPYHLFDLARFLKANQDLGKMENSIPLSISAKTCREIKEALGQVVTDDFANIRLTAEEAGLREEINGVEKKIADQLTLYEAEIFEQTGLKMIYPYPKEIQKDDGNIDRIKQCQHLEVRDEGEFYGIHFRLSSVIKNLIDEKESVREQWHSLMDEKISGVNRTLSGFYQEFSRYYEARKQRIFDYILLDASRKSGLTFPSLSAKPGIRLKKGILPSLKQRKTDDYKPLDLELEPGTNLLFGANMTGKTTVLKTLYFHLILAGFGLPVPAESLELSWPPAVELQLKSSGDTGLGLSGFADEIRFFCKKAAPSSVFLIDELFQSTDPVNGVKLSEAFLTGLLDSNSIYLCTSHYPEVLNIAGVRFFRMKDPEGEINTDELEKLLEQVPYEVESITAERMKGIVEQNNKPLLIALQFPLPENIKQNIKKRIHH